jgi:hypothetical protein
LIILIQNRVMQEVYSNSNEGSTLTPNSPLLKNKKLSSKIKTEQNKSLRPSAEDSFHVSKKATSPTGNIQPVATKASNKGITPLISTALIALASLGVGAGTIFLGVKYFNLFELGQKTKTTVTEKIPEAVATALKLGKEATQEQITKKIDDLQSTITKLEDATDKLAKATYDLNQKENDLQTSLTTQKKAEAEVVEKNTEIEEQKQQIELLQQELIGVKEELKETETLFQDSFRRDSEKDGIIEELETKVKQFLTSNKNLVTKLDALNQEIARLRIKLREEQATGLKVDTQLFGTLNSLPEVWGSEKLSKCVSSALLTPSSLKITEIEHPQNLFNLQQKVYEQLEELDPKYKGGYGIKVCMLE